MSQIKVNDPNKSAKLVIRNPVGQGPGIKVIPKKTSVSSMMSSSQDNFSSHKPELTRDPEPIPMGLDLIANPKKQIDTDSDFSDDSDDEMVAQHEERNRQHDMFSRVEENYDMDSRHQRVADQGSDSEFDEEEFDDIQSESGRPTRYQTYEEKQRMKQEALMDLRKYADQGIPVNGQFTMASDLEDILFERNRIKRQLEVQAAIKSYRKYLMIFVTIVEYLNDRFDPLGLQLNGWSEAVMQDLNSYDEIFEELHDKYKTKVKLPPEIRLIIALGTSAFMFHLTNHLFRGGLGGAGPDFMQNMQNFAKKAMGNPAMFGNVGGPPPAPMPMGSNPGFYAQPNFNANKPPDPKPQADDLSGPEDMDDLLDKIIASGGNEASVKNVDIINRGRKKMPPMRPVIEIKG